MKVTDQIFDETPGGAPKTESGAGGWVDFAGFWHPKGQTLVRLGGSARRTARGWDPLDVSGNWDPLSRWPPKKY